MNLTYIPGTRFKLSQLLAELADGASIGDIAKDFDLPMDGLIRAIRKIASEMEQNGK